MSHAVWIGKVRSISRLQMRPRALGRADFLGEERAQDRRGEAAVVFLLDPRITGIVPEQGIASGRPEIPDRYWIGPPQAAEWGAISVVEIGYVRRFEITSVMALIFADDRATRRNRRAGMRKRSKNLG